MPITCSNKHDMLFHILYGCNTDMLLELIHSSATRLYTLTGCQHLHDSVTLVMREKEKIGLDKLRCMFFIFLNVDMMLKMYICDPSNVHMLAKLFSMDIEDPMIHKLRTYDMVHTTPITPPKARGFLQQLHGSIINNWLQNDRQSCSDLVTSIKHEYLQA
jgi:hypothetical protein